MVWPQDNSNNNNSTLIEMTGIKKKAWFIEISLLIKLVRLIYIQYKQSALSHISFVSSFHRLAIVSPLIFECIKWMSRYDWYYLKVPWFAIGASSWLKFPSSLTICISSVANKAARSLWIQLTTQLNQWNEWRKLGFSQSSATTARATPTKMIRFYKIRLGC